MKRRMIPLLVAAIAAGYSPAYADTDRPERAPTTLGEGVGNLILSPFFIVAGLLEGLASLPYLASQDVHQVDKAMVDAKANVDLGRTYQYAYQERLENVPASGETGKVFRHMSEATLKFQEVLKGYGVENYQHYFLTAVRTADRDGYTLYAVVYRPEGAVRVLDKSGRGEALMLGPRDEKYFQPYQRDAQGRSLDVIIDWAGVPRVDIRTQKGQAILMTLAANSVLVNRRSDDYWDIERRWMAGDYKNIVAERKQYLDQRLGVRSG